MTYDFCKQFRKGGPRRRMRGWTQTATTGDSTQDTNSTRHTCTTHCNTLQQHTAPRRNTLQHTATHAISRHTCTPHLHIIPRAGSSAVHSYMANIEIHSNLEIARALRAHTHSHTHIHTHTHIRGAWLPKRIMVVLGWMQEAVYSCACWAVALALRSVILVL